MLWNWKCKDSTSLANIRESISDLVDYILHAIFVARHDVEL